MKEQLQSKKLECQLKRGKVIIEKIQVKPGCLLRCKVV